MLSRRHPDSRTATTRPGPTEVLWTVSTDPKGVDFRAQMLAALDDSATVVNFSWRRALWSRYDVFHVQWPEVLVRHPLLVGRMAKTFLTLWLLARLRILGIPVVITAHNIRPHEEAGVLERLVVETLQRSVDVTIALNAADAAQIPSAILAPHPHFRDFVSCADPSSARPRAITFFGYVRPYKGLERLIECLVADPSLDVEVNIVGQPLSEDYGHFLTSLADGDRRIRFRLQFADDAELVDAISSASLVVLPYREMHNSGAVLLALSIGRPVLIPEGGAGAALQREFGTEWVHLLGPEGICESIARALGDRRWKRTPIGMPGRDLSAFAAAHREAYRRATESRRPASRRRCRHAG